MISTLSRRIGVWLYSAVGRVVCKTGGHSFVVKYFSSVRIDGVWSGNTTFFNSSSNFVSCLGIGSAAKYELRICLIRTREQQQNALSYWFGAFCLTSPRLGM